MANNVPNNVEVEGNTVEDAIKKALSILKVSREEIIVKVVVEEQKGLFGMEGAKPAKIKVSLKADNNSWFLIACSNGNLKGQYVSRETY